VQQFENIIKEMCNKKW